MWYEMLKSAAALALILGMIFLLAYLAKRFNALRGRSGQGVHGWRILGVKSLGPRKQVFIVEAGTRILLIGSTDKMMTTLAEIHGDEERAALLGAVEAERPAVASFSDLLKKVSS
ncbi:flagellar biosynthetic protein FliO [candidate division KSB1 bacterium]|nr:flagellar biosynthetic protein FliO [candidate division KSB1 bacterium]